jgi:Domain of unknown function DUF29
MATSARAKPQNPPPPPSRTRYEDDLYTWVQEQVALLRAGRFDEVDALNVAEELSDVGKSEFRSLQSSIAVLTMHLLKWDYQPARRSISWMATVRELRRSIVRVLKQNPGLKSRLAEALEEGYADGLDRAVSETELDYSVFPEACPYTFDEMMARPVIYQKPAKRAKRS